MVAGVNAPKLVVVVGPTASGKSELALKLAQKLRGEIICADSWTIRKKLNIGSAKPSLEDQRLIKHHLLDLIEPNEKFSAARFKKLCNQAIASISLAGKLPIMVGGSGLYIDGVIFDYSFIKADTSKRDELNKLSTDELLNLIKKSKLSLKGVDIHNRRRLVRLIESKGQKPKKGSIRPNTLIVGLAIDKDELKKRIESRINLMIEAGLEDEVKELVNAYGWSSEALRGINYYEWREYLDGKENIKKVGQNLVADNLKLAKKQMTWFRKNKSIQWMTTPVKLPNVVDMITTFMDN